MQCRFRKYEHNILRFLVKIWRIKAWTPLSQLSTTDKFGSVWFSKDSEPVRNFLLECSISIHDCKFVMKAWLKSHVVTCYIWHNISFSCSIFLDSRLTSQYTCHLCINGSILCGFKCPYRSNEEVNNTTKIRLTLIYFQGRGPSDSCSRVGE